MKTLITLATLLGIALGSAACNTVQGIGKDIQRGGEAVQEVAKKK